MFRVLACSHLENNTFVVVRFWTLDRLSDTPQATRETIEKLSRVNNGWEMEFYGFDCHIGKAQSGNMGDFYVVSHP